MRNGYRDVVHRGHRFDGNCPFYDAIAANHSKVDLSIRGHRGFKDGSPIKVPTGEDRAYITCDGEEKWLPMHMRQAHAITGVRQWSVFGEMRHGILADFEIATVLRSSRVAFCFSFRHSWKHRRANQ
jgi:hypothetical protein